MASTACVVRQGTDHKKKSCACVYEFRSTALAGGKIWTKFNLHKRNSKRYAE